MYKTVTEFSIGRKALMRSEYDRFDRISMTDSADKTDVDPAEMIASIIAVIIEKEADI